MKRIITLAATLSGAVSLCAQGLVNFANTPTTLVSVQAPEPHGPYSLMSGPAGSYYFELFLGIPIAGNYTATGVYATNTGVDGLFNGGTAAVPGWAAGISKTYFVAGWDAGMGHDLDPSWFGGSTGDFGGAAGAGVAGDGNSIPVLNLFDGGGNTITFGFQLRNTLIPEPTALAIAAVGAALILFCRMKRKSPRNLNEKTAS